MKRAAAIANWLAISRIVLIPVFVFSIIYSQEDGPYLNLARVVFLYGVLSDVLDGRLAALTESNPIGQFLDPLADKICLAAIFISLSLVWHNPPLWLTCIVVGRFVVLRLLWFILFSKSNQGLSLFLEKKSILTKPNLLGKASSWSQVILVVSILFFLPEVWINLLCPLVAVITVAAGGTYLILGLREAKKFRCLT